MISSNELGSYFSTRLLSTPFGQKLSAATTSEPVAVVKNPLEGYDPYLVKWIPESIKFYPEINAAFKSDGQSIADEIDRLNELYSQATPEQKFATWQVGAVAFAGAKSNLPEMWKEKYVWDFKPDDYNERVRAEETHLKAVYQILAERAARGDKSPFEKMKEDAEALSKKVADTIETALGYGPEVREQIDRTVYTGVYGNKWKEFGPTLTWVLVKLQQQSSSLGQWMEAADAVMSYASAYFTDERGKETEDKANKEWQGIAVNSDPVMTRAFAYLAKKGVMKDTSLKSAGALSPEDVQLFADQYIDAEKQDRRGRYYFAFQNIFQQIDDMVSGLEATESAGPAVVQTVVNIAERLSGMLPEGAVTDFEARGWTLDEVIAAVTKSTYGQTLNTQEKEMVELFNQYSGTEEEKKKQAEKQTSSLIMPGLMFAFSLFK